MLLEIGYFIKNSFMINYQTLQIIEFEFHIFINLFHLLLQVKQEDMPPRIQYATLYLLFIGGAYFFSYTRVALCLLVLQYFTETVFHTRLDFAIYIPKRPELKNNLFLSATFFQILFDFVILHSLLQYSLVSFFFISFHFYSQNIFMP